MNTIRSSLDECFSFNSEFIICGDFNINYNLRHTDSFQLLKDFERDYIATQIIKKDTRITSKSSTLIDLIFTNCSDIINSGTIDSCISDHEIVYLVKMKVRSKIEFTSINARTFRNFIKDDFQADIRNDDRWDMFWLTHDVDIAWDIFESIISTHANHHCPVKEIRVRNDSPHWFSRELLEEIYHRDRLYKRAKFSKDKQDFQTKRKEVKIMLLRLKEEYISSKLNEEKQDPKRFWRSLNELTGFGRNKTKKGLSNIISDSGDTLEGEAAANYMNEFYTTAGPKLATKFNDDWSEDSSKIRCDTVFSFEFISEETVSKLCKNIKISKSSAMGLLSTRILKDRFEVCIVELTHIFNMCIESGSFPKSWGVGEITPIPKVSVSSKKPEIGAQLLKLNCLVNFWKDVYILRFFHILILITY